MTKAKKRIGRPFKQLRKDVRRLSIGLWVTREIKQLLTQEARRTGRTQSQVAELMIERCHQYNLTLAAIAQVATDRRAGAADLLMDVMAQRCPHCEPRVIDGATSADPAIVRLTIDELRTILAATSITGEVPHDATL